VADSTAPAIARLAERKLSTKFGTWQEFLYYNGITESFALAYGDIAGKRAVPCRVHSACLSAHVFNSIECDCREQMALAQSMIQGLGYGLIIWLDQEGRGNGHLALMRAARLAAETGIPQTEAYRRLGYSDDQRRYLAATAILRDLDVTSVRLISNSPAKSAALAADGIEVIDMLPVAVDLADYPQLRAYYEDKAARGHEFPANHRG
jgi:GTP cyclohydrolase II